METSLLPNEPNTRPTSRAAPRFCCVSRPARASPPEYASIGSPAVSSTSGLAYTVSTDAMQLLPPSLLVSKLRIIVLGQWHVQGRVASCRSASNCWSDESPQTLPGRSQHGLRHHVSKQLLRASVPATTFSSSQSCSVRLPSTASLRLAPGWLVQPPCEVTQLSEQCGSIRCIFLSWASTVG